MVVLFISLAPIYILNNYLLKKNLKKTTKHITLDECIFIECADVK